MLLAIYFRAPLLQTSPFLARAATGIDVHVLTASYWPHYQPAPAIVPDQVRAQYDMHGRVHHGAPPPTSPRVPPMRCAVRAAATEPGCVRWLLRDQVQ